MKISAAPQRVFSQQFAPHFVFWQLVLFDTPKHCSRLSPQQDTAFPAYFSIPDSFCSKHGWFLPIHQVFQGGRVLGWL